MRQSKQTNVKQDRRGSMLIMVVVILVLLALIGTAMISTSRLDRVSTVQHSVNVQVDLLLESVKDLAKAVLVDDLFGNNVYKAPGGAYQPQDSTQEDRYLGARAPASEDPNLAVGGGNAVYWPSITYPLLNSSLTSATFEAPGRQPITLTAPKSQYRFVPTFGTFAGRTDWPMLQAFWFDGAAWQDVGTFPAVDTDGDGIADAGLCKLPMGELNGVSYYFAVRLIDHGSAVNLSTAWKANDDAVDIGANQVPGDFFPTNVNLMTFLADGVSPNTALEQILALNQYRFNDLNPTPAWNATPVLDDGSTRADFVFMSGYDALWNQLGRRLTNPGRNQPGTSYQALGSADGAALAYPFGLYYSSAGSSEVGTRLAASLQTNAPTAKFKGATAVADWFGRNFDHLRLYQTARDTMNVRALSVTRNGVSDVAPVYDMVPSLGANQDAGYLTSNPAARPDQIPFYNRANNEIVPRTSVNTAPFNYLWRAFYNVMAANPGVPPYVHEGVMSGPTTDGRMFRPVLRDPATPEVAPTMTSAEVMMLRAAIAAVNAVDLRDADYHVTSRRVVIRDSATGNTDAKYEATVFGAEPQPFITEVYVNTDNVTAGAGGANPRGYIAIELHNPYPFAISLANWQLGILTRQNATAAPTATDPYPNMRLKPLTGFTGFGAVGQPETAPHIIPAGGYLVLENYTNGGAAVNPGDALSRPAEVGLPAKALYVPGLHEVLPDPVATPTPLDGTELVLLRPRRAVLNGNILENDHPCRNTTAGDPMGEFDEGTVAAPRLFDMVPVDSFDFAGLVNPPAGGPAFTALHYVRPNGPGQEWKFVYPGRYTASAASLRHEGTQIVTWNPTPDASDPNPPPATNPWDPASPNYTAPSPAIALGAADGAGSYGNPFPGIQWANTDHAGPRMPTQAGPNVFPFNGFARNGDMLHIPFIGTYVLRTAADAAGTPLTDRSLILEANTVSLDSQLAEDGDAADNTIENIGRFTPLLATDPSRTADDHYAWAADLFDHLAVRSPADDYLPDVDPGQSQSVTLADGTVEALNRYPAAQPVAVKNSTTANAYDNRMPGMANPEALLTTEGLINLNTAPYFVIGQLPFVPNAGVNMPRDILSVDAAGNVTGTVGSPQPNGVPDNIDIARIIVAYRDGYQLGFGAPAGPFRSLFDLNRIVSANGLTFQSGFQETAAAANVFANEPDDADGDLSPLGATTDLVRNDYEERFLMINRISNLVTLRSDVFTCYLSLLGFRNANGPGDPELAVQRNAVMILDRSSVKTKGDLPEATNVPRE